MASRIVLDIPPAGIGSSSRIPFRSLVDRMFSTPDRRAIAILGTIVTIVSILRLWVQPGLGDWDIVTFYLPWYAFMGEQLRAGNIPGWNPHIFSGMPFAGDPQSGWWYFPAMLFFTALPAVLAFKIFIWFHLLLSALAVYVLARLLGLRALGGFTAGLIFSCLQVGAALTFMIQMQMAPWIVVALIGIELGRRSADWKRFCAGILLSALAFSQILGCYLGQGSYYAALFLAAYIVWRLFLFPEASWLSAWKTRLIATGVAGVLTFGVAVLIGAAGIWPRFEAVKRAYVGSDAYRGADWEPNRGWDSWDVSTRVFQLTLQKFDNYIGGGMVTLALLGIVCLPRHRRFLIFVATAIVALELPLRPTRLHDLFYLLPRFKETHLHDPGRVLALVPIAVAMMAGLAMDQLRPLTRSWRLPVGLILVTIAWQRLLRADHARDQWMMEGVTKLSAGIVVTSVAMYGLIRLMRTKPVWISRVQALLIGGLFAGLFIDPVGYALSKPVKSSASESQLASAITTGAAKTDSEGAGAYITAQIEAEGQPFRYLGYSAPPEYYAPLHETFDQGWVEALLSNNRAMRLGLFDAEGYNPAQIVRYQSAFTAMNGFEREYHEALVQEPGLGSPILDMLNVRYIIVPNDVSADTNGQLSTGPYPAQYVEVWKNGTVTVLENRNVLPHAWIVHDAVTLDSTTALQQINAGTIDPGTTATVEQTPPAMSAPIDPAAESVSITAYSSDQVTLQATATGDGMLVLSDVYDPNWEVTVDGEGAQLYVVDGVLRGVALSAGTHTISFSYEPDSLRYGLIVSLVTIGGMIVFLAYVYRETKRP